MRLFYRFALATLSGLVFWACTRTDEMQAKIDEYASILKNPMKKEKGDSPQKAGVIATLNRQYPQASPIPRDSAQRVLQALLPSTIGPWKLTTKNALEYINQDQIGISKNHPVVPPITKPYFSIYADYSTPKAAGKETQGFLLGVFDRGFYPKWLGRFLSNQVTKGENIIFDFIRIAQHQEYQKTISYQGHQWALWKSKPHPATVNGKPLPLPTLTFVTIWNDRFAILFHTTDTTRATPDYSEQIINYEWLEKLGYPER